MERTSSGRRGRAHGHCYLLVGLALLSPPSLSGALLEADAVDDPVMVTATRQPYSSREAPFPVEVYTRADIERSGASNFYDFLISQTSLTVLPNYGNPAQRLIEMRGYGLESGYESVVVTLDGYRLNNIDSAPATLTNISLDAIERVEIIRGGGAASSGDGALAGSINIVTRETNGVNVRMSAGDKGQRLGSASFGLAAEAFSLSGNVGAESLDGAARPDAQGNRDSSSTSSGDLRGKLRIGGVELRAAVFAIDGYAFFRNPLTRGQIASDPTQTVGNNTRFDQNGSRTSLGFMVPLTDSISFDVERNIENKRYLFDYGYGPSPQDYESDTNRAVARWSPGAASLLLGYETLDAQRDAFGFFTSKQSNAYFFQPSYRLGDTTLSAGWRSEDVQFAQSNSAGLVRRSDALRLWDLGVNHRLDAAWNVFANVSRAEQTPDVDRFFALFSGVPAFTGFVAPARSTTLNLGTRARWVRGGLDATLFYSRLRDEIYYDPFAGLNSNLDRSHKYGLELRMDRRVGERLTVRAAYQYTRSIIDAENGQPSYEGRDLPGVPRHGINVGMDWMISPAATLSITQVYRSPSYAIGDLENSGLKQKPIRLTNALVRYQIDKSWQAFAAVDNLFSEHNAIYVSGGTMGYPSDYVRLWRFGIRADF